MSRKGAVGIDEFQICVRATGKPGQALFVYEVKVDMHQVSALPRG